MRAWGPSAIARTVAFLGVLTLLVGMPGSSQAETPAVLLGSVRDAVGNALSGVDVLLVRPDDPTTAVAETRSDRRGKFVLAGLIPGLYKVAAVKRGYRTFLGRVDTFAAGTLDLILQPTLDVDTDDVPRTSSWQLRLPRRSIFREIRPGASDDPLDGPSGADWARSAREVRMQVDQMFSVGAGGQKPQRDSPDLSTSETRMILASALGERGSLRVQGSRRRFGTPEAPGFVRPGASQANASMTMALSYATDADAELAIRAFYDAADYRLGHQSDLSSIRQEQTTWGYDASWKKRLDQDSHVAVQVDYHDLQLVDAEDSRLAGPGTNPGNSRTVAAQGSFERVADERHQLQVAVRAQLIEPPTRTEPGALPTSGDSVGSGWSVQAEAQDTFAVSAPLNIVYGVAYKQTLVDQAATMIVPRLGGSWSMDGWLLSALLSHHTVRESGSGGSPGVSPFRPEDALGYEALLELPLSRGVRLAGGATYEPIRFDHVGYAGGSTGGGPLYLTDGNTAVREQRLRLVEDRGGTQTYFEISIGRAQGTLAALLPFDMTMQLESGRELRYSSGMFGVRVPGRGADLVLEYQRVVAGTETDDARRDSIQESVEVRVRKDMWNLISAGDWRLLMAVRMGLVEADGLDEPSFEGGRQTLNALNTRISAGVSVVF